MSDLYVTENPRKIDSMRIAYTSGFIGSAVFLLGALISGCTLGSTGPGHLSIFNHYISELGVTVVSREAILFNVSLILGGVSIIVFMMAMSHYMENRIACHASAAGAFAGCCCSLIGAFPMNGRIMHPLVAYSFFFSGMVSVLLFIVAIIFDTRHKVARWLVFPGSLSLACFVMFLFATYLTGLSTALSLSVYRIQIVPASFFEWSVFASTILWILLASSYLFLKRHRSTKRTPL